MSNLIASTAGAPPACPPLAIRAFSIITALAIAMAAFLHGGGPAQAAPTSAAEGLSASQQARADALASKLGQLSEGESLEWSEAGADTVIFTKTQGKIAVAADSSAAKPTTTGISTMASNGVCKFAYPAAVGLFVLGGVGLAALTFATAGAGGAVVGGVFLTSTELGAAAGISGGMAGLYAWLQGMWC